MFQSMRQRFETLLSRVDDILADHPDEPREDAPAAVLPHADHPHRQPLRSRRARRPGQVPAAPAYCLSPVRHPVGARRQQITSTRPGA
jgi:hypothetical protein